MYNAVIRKANRQRETRVMHKEPVVETAKHYPPLIAAGMIAFYSLHGLPLSEPFLVAVVACVEHHVAQGISYVVLVIRKDAKKVEKWK